MPRYTFSCPNGHQFQAFAQINEQALACKICSAISTRLLPKLSDKTDLKEKVDSFTGIQRAPDQKDLVESRNKDHYWQIEVPRLVNSGTYSIQSMLEYGWVYYNDKGQIQIRDHPPNRDK